MIAVCDTHALLWFATGKVKKLGKSARRYLEKADKGADVAIYVPTVVLVEVAEAVEARRVKLSHPFAEWVRRLLAAGPFIATDLTTDVVLAAEMLSGIPERADRMIAASALVLGCPLITRDPEIIAAADAGIETIWD